MHSKSYCCGMVMSVSELAERTGTSPDTVRYYGRLGLLPETGRNSAGHRYYNEAAVERLRFIKGAQWLDMRLEEIRQLVDMLDGGGCPCRFSQELVRRRIAAIDQQRARLDEMRALLCRLLGGSWSGTEPHPTAMELKEDDVAMNTPDASTGVLDRQTQQSDGACLCYRSTAPTSVDDEVRELEARRAAVERRLSAFVGPKDSSS